MKYAQYEPYYNQEDKAKLHELVDSNTWFAEFENVDSFEKKLAEVTGNKYALAVNNGTVAISIVLSALGVRPYDQVIVPDITMVATANAVRFIGATPVFGDIDPSNGCLDVDKAIKLAELVGARAIVYVTLNGRMDYNGIIKLKKYCDENSIWLIKDDAQSLGSKTVTNNSLQDSSFADVHTLSFSPHKIVSCGQGGAIVTSNDQLWEKFKRMKDFGRISGGADIHDYFGINSKFTELQATLGLSQVNRLDQLKQKKIEIYNTYKNNLSDVKEIFMFDLKEGTVPWFVDIYVENRDQLFLDLKEIGIGTRKLYPALQTQSCYDTRENLHEDCKPTESIIFSNKGLWLPSSLSLTSDNIIEICNVIKETI